MQDIRIVKEFPDYGVTKEGDIYNLETEQIRRASFTREGAVKITLYLDGIPYTRSLAKIVAEAWVDPIFNSDIFDTPIHLDNDLSNNHADNLAWRPRWFAVKYQRQYWNEDFRFARTRVQDVDTGIVYDTYIEPCQTFGILYMDLIQSCLQGKDVFPTSKTFEYV